MVRMTGRVILKTQKMVLMSLRLPLYRGKETIHSEIELIIYQLKWYISTNIISLSL